MLRSPTKSDVRSRLRIRVTGRVQGVGFRPWISRVANEIGLTGSVRNEARGVLIDIEGESEQTARFLARLEGESPAASEIDSVETWPIEAEGSAEFEISPSRKGGPAGPLPLDAAPCSECLDELFLAGNRRHRYPFVSCAVCGPRYSIVEELPYDRAGTSMRSFPLCRECDEEYRDPQDRRFHAESISCPACGPRLTALDTHGRAVAREGAALDRATAVIAAGGIVAMKGVGGFQLVVAARNDQAVARLRAAKERPDKPFALMVRSLDDARRLCRVDAIARSTVSCPRSPIVLLPRARGGADVAAGVAPANLDLGVMLPASPLHHLVAADLGVPLVVTSANHSGEPICFRDEDAVKLLPRMADLVLLHDRAIVHPVDDSVVRVVHGAPRLLRAARGYAPISLPVDSARPGVVGRGAHLKNTVAVSGHGTVRLSPHIGDLRSRASRVVAAEIGRWFCALEQSDRAPHAVIDLHPESASSGGEVEKVQHHHAHVLSCLAENRVTDAVLGVAWDGNGYGPDGTIWGGEFLACDQRAFRRVAHLRTFPLPGAERAIVEGRRAALGLLYELEGAKALHDLELAPVQSFRLSERRTIARMLQRGLNCPQTSSMGRLFDAVAALAGIRQKATFEGQAALALEQAARGAPKKEPYPFPLRHEGAERPVVADWGPLIAAVKRDVRAGQSTASISVRFHEALVELLVAVAREMGFGQVALSGGCFQNQLLLSRAIDRLRSAGFDPLVHRYVPPNDACVALGQAVHASTGPE